MTSVEVAMTRIERINLWGSIEGFIGDVISEFGTQW
jgi:hypothetical protein